MRWIGVLLQVLHFLLFYVGPFVLKCSLSVHPWGAECLWFTSGSDEMLPVTFVAMKKKNTRMGGFTV